MKFYTVACTDKGDLSFSQLPLVRAVASVKNIIILTRVNINKISCTLQTSKNVATGTVLAPEY